MDNFTARQVNKVRIVHRDLELGHGTVDQTRNGTTATEHKLEIEFIFRSIAEITALDTSLYTYVALAEGETLTSFWYDPTSRDIADGESVLIADSNTGLGRWLLLNNAPKTLPIDAIVGLEDALANISANIAEVQGETDDLNNRVNILEAAARAAELVQET